MKNVYFVGIKGVGMTALALHAKEAGLNVAGSDVTDEFITDAQLKKARIHVYEGFDAANVDSFFTGKEDNALIFTAAHSGADNTEVQRASERGIQTFSLGMATGKLMDGELWEEKKTGISVAGTHGKTTTSALIAHILTQLQQDPSYLIGSSDIYPLGSPGHSGKGKYLVVEADEYVSDTKTEKQSKFLQQHPDMAVITNIDYDHPDVFADMSAVKKAFSEFVQNVKECLIVNIDDVNTHDVVGKSGKKYVTFGQSPEADFRIKNITTKSQKIHFDIECGTKSYACQLSLPGPHNVANATAAVALLDVLGYAPERAIPHLSTFVGAKRRSEEKGKTKKGALVVDDYAHHPKEIQTTLIGLTQKYNKKIICIFQPHTYSRTQALLTEFARSFEKADTLLLLPIFASAREKESASLTNEKYIQAFSVHPSMHYFQDGEAVIKYLQDSHFNDEYLIVTMGAGDVYKIGEALIGHEDSIV